MQSSIVSALLASIALANENIFEMAQARDLKDKVGPKDPIVPVVTDFMGTDGLMEGMKVSFNRRLCYENRSYFDPASGHFVDSHKLGRKSGFTQRITPITNEENGGLTGFQVCLTKDGTSCFGSYDVDFD